MAFIQPLRLLSRSCSTHLKKGRNLYILSNPEFVDDTKLKQISQVIEDLSSSVIGGPTSYNPEEYNRRYCIRISQIHRYYEPEIGLIGTGKESGTRQI